MSDGDALDPAALARLQEWGGERLLGQMVRLFLENAPGRMEQIRTGLTGGDIKESERGSHSLKSSAANIGAMQVRDLAADMERVAAGGDASAASELLLPLEAAFARAVSALESVERGLNP